MEQGDDPYQILGVTQTATASDVKKSYRKLALRYHPDKNPKDDDAAAAMFAKVAQAYQILSDVERRDQYDLRQRCGARGFDKNTCYDTGNTVKTTTQESSSSVPSRRTTNTNSKGSSTTQTYHHYSPKVNTTKQSKPHRTNTNTNTTNSSRRKTTTTTTHSPSEPIQVTFTGTIPEELRAKYQDPQELFKAMFAKEYGHDPDFLKDVGNNQNIQVVLQQPTTTCSKSIATKNYNKSKKPTATKSQLQQNTQSTKQPKTKKNVTGTSPVSIEKANAVGRKNGSSSTNDSGATEQRSMQSSTRQVLRPDGSIETITETTYTYMNGRTETTRQSSIQPPSKSRRDGQTFSPQNKSLWSPRRGKESGTKHGLYGDRNVVRIW